MKPFSAKAPGKILIAGEYGVLIGHPALAVAVDRWAFCHVEPSPKLAISSNLSPKTIWSQINGSWSPKNPSKDAAVVRAVFQALSELELDIPNAHYFLDTSQFYRSTGGKFGLGSSSAVITAFCAALLKLNGQYEPKKLFELAFKAHHLFSKGLGSGFDIAVACFGGGLCYRLNSQTQKAEISPWCLSSQFSEELVIIDINHAQNTRVFVEQFLKRKNKAVEQICENMAAHTRDLQQGYDANPITIFQALYAELISLGRAIKCPIIGPKHQTIAQIALAHEGAAKSCGAGGGDLSLALIPVEEIPHFKRALAKRGFNSLSLGLRAPGAAVG